MIKRQYTKQEMHIAIAHELLHSLAQPWDGFPPDGLFSMMLYGVEYFFVQLGSAVSSCDLSQVLLHPQPTHWYSSINIFLAQALPRALFAVLAACTSTCFRYSNFQSLSSWTLPCICDAVKLYLNGIKLHFLQIVSPFHQNQQLLPCSCSSP